MSLTMLRFAATVVYYACYATVHLQVHSASGTIQAARLPYPSSRRAYKALTPSFDPYLMVTCV